LYLAIRHLAESASIKLLLLFLHDLGESELHSVGWLKCGLSQTMQNISHKWVAAWLSGNGVVHINKVTYVRPS